MCATMFQVFLLVVFVPAVTALHVTQQHHQQQLQTCENGTATTSLLMLNSSKTKDPEVAHPVSKLTRTQTTARHTLPGTPGSAVGPDGLPSFRQTLKNFEDTQYTADVYVGGQKLQGIIDTGSFEVLVFGDQCKTCGDNMLYDKHKSAGTYAAGSGLTSVHSFGSGNTDSVEGYEKMDIGPYSVTNQAFWEVTATDMKVLAATDGLFSVILGVGPPNSALKIAKEEANSAAETIKEAERQGIRVPQDVRSRAKDDIEQAKHQAHKKSLSQNLGISTFSVCIGKEVGSPGYFIWNDAHPDNQPFLFTSIPVVGEIHWGVELTYVKLGHQKWDMSPEYAQLGCNPTAGDKTGCGAVVDSGTSLISAPKYIAQGVSAALKKLKVNCSNLKGLPDLVFSLGGTEFSLPADSYIGEVDGYYVNKPNVTVKFCQPLLMAMDTPTQFGPMWVLGLPFFRKYYVSFVHNANAADGNIKRHLFMAEASDDCRPQKDIAMMQTGAFVSPSSDSIAGPERANTRARRVHKDKLRLPAWAQAAKATAPGTVYEL